MGHSVSKAADNAVEKSKKVKAADRTDLQIIADMRRNFAAGLAVTADDQKWLLAQYDALVEKDLDGQIGYMQVRITQLVEENTQMTTKLQEFRDVYEQENRSMAVKVERTLDEVPQVAVTVESEYKAPVEGSILTAAAAAGVEA